MSEVDIIKKYINLHIELHGVQDFCVESVVEDIKKEIKVVDIKLVEQIIKEKK